MPRDTNNGDDYEAHYFPDPVRQRDVDRDMEDAKEEAEIALERMQFSDAGMQRLADALNPAKFNEIWKKVNGL